MQRAQTSAATYRKDVWRPPVGSWSRQRSANDLNAGRCDTTVSSRCGQSRNSDGSEHEVLVELISALESGNANARCEFMLCKHERFERLTFVIDFNSRVMKSEPTAGDRIPRLEHALLRAEQ